MCKGIERAGIMGTVALVVTVVTAVASMEYDMPYLAPCISAIAIIAVMVERKWLSK